MIRRAALLLLLGAALVYSVGCASGDDDDESSANADDDSTDDDVPSDDDSDDDASPDIAYPFPDGFLFGTASAGFQHEMGCPTLPDDECADRGSDWYAYMVADETRSRPRTFLSDEDPAAIGPGQWELYEQDLDLIADDLAGNAYRLGIEWSRIFPTSTVGIEGFEALRAVANAGAIEHYHDLFAAMRGRGLTPAVTLNHYTLPLWIHDGVGCTVDLATCSPRGWLDGDLIVPEIAKYAGFVAREFAADVDWWLTLNEPISVLMPGFLLPTPDRTNPPAAILDGDDFVLATENMIEAHARMVDAVRANDAEDADGDDVPEQVGLVYNMAPVRAMDETNPIDVRTAENIFYLWNLLVMDGVGLGLWDGDLDGQGEVRDEWTDRLDFWGLNYYVRITVEGMPFSLLPETTPLLTLNPLTVVFDEVYPRGLYETTLYMTERYHVPILVTENNAGMIAKDRVDLETRYLVEYLSWLSRAIRDGADIRGYFYWSLIDNIEWNKGSTFPVGLFAVDAGDPQKPRSPRPIADVYARIAEDGGVPRDLAVAYPID